MSQVTYELAADQLDLVNFGREPLLVSEKSSEGLVLLEQNVTKGTI